MAEDEYVYSELFPEEAGMVKQDPGLVRDLPVNPLVEYG